MRKVVSRRQLLSVVGDAVLSSFSFLFFEFLGFRFEIPSRIVEIIRKSCGNLLELLGTVRNSIIVIMFNTLISTSGKSKQLKQAQELFAATDVLGSWGPCGPGI